jgi:zinc/manganese transport system substrate-binding protein
MQKMLQWVAIAAVIVVAVSAVGYEVYSSSAPPGDQCASVDKTTSNTGQTSASHPASPTGHQVRLGSAAAGPSRRASGSSSAKVPVRPTTSGVIQVVAAENFWGSLVGQLGGNDTSVVSIVTDPNTDPHEYEANSSAAVAIANAQFVIVNGVGYDDWALSLIQADGNTHQVVLNVGDLNGVTVGGGIVSGNPHQWYDPVYVNRTVAAMYSDLASIAPGDLTTFQQNYGALNASLASLYGRATLIKQLYAGTEVASTESIFVYLANFTDLDLVSPPAFMEAVAEGNDPSPQDVVTFQCQLESGHVKVLVYNEQTVTPVTINLKAIAAAHNVTTVGVTETIQPPGVTFQVWMNAEYLQLQNALNAQALGQ